VLSAAKLTHLPRRTLTVTFIAGTASQTDTENGPPLAAAPALRARIRAYPQVAEHTSRGLTC
jgi:hypothetical protein